MNSKQLIERLFVETFAIWRLDDVVNDWGGDSQEPTLDSSFDGFLQTRAADKGVINAKDEYIEALVIYAPVDAGLIPSDEIRYDSKRYKVTYIQPTKGIAGLARHQEVGLTFIGNVQS